MKESISKGMILKILIKNFAILFVLNIIFSMMCDVSISKLKKDVLRDFENYKVAIILNDTHFSCDDGENILDLDKFNDDFCDCKDGSDENRTNACLNGKFKCQNRFYEKKLISTNKVNDGICDCCSGEDEFPNLNCPKLCLQHSKKEYQRLLENFEALKGVVESYKKDTIDSYFDSTREIIEELKNIYSTIKELKEKKYLLKSYLNKIEGSLSEDDKEFVDENDILYGSLLKAYEIINDKINHYEERLKNLENDKSSLIRFNLFKDSTQSPITVKYKYFDCEFDFSQFKCRGSKPDGGRWRYKNLGEFDYLEDNVIYFKRGESCHSYNKSYGARIYIECSYVDSFEFANKIDGCLYEFVYKTKLGCNSKMLNNTIERVKLLLSEV